MSKGIATLLVTRFTGNIGAADGALETLSVRSCNGDSLEVGLSAATTASNFVTRIPIDLLGRLGGGFSALFTSANVIGSKKITASDTLGILAGISAAAGILPAAAVFTVSGMAVTLYDNLKHRGNDGCVRPPYIPLGGLVPPQGPPDIDPASQASSPLIIDMDRNGIKTISIDKGVFFDLDNNLFAENTGWVGQGDALLVWDRDGNGIIDSGNELFGNNTLLANGSKAANGFAALAELDSNNDKVFDEQDEAWAKLQLWFDHNQNGISEEGELINLSESGIKSINLAYKNIKHTDENGNAHRQQSSVTWHNGETSEITDVWFKVNTAKSYYREEIEVSDEIKAMPNIIAFGNVLNLHEAMAKNSTLKNVVQEYIDTDVEKRSSLLNYLIYEWTGTVNVEPESRGSHIDARKVAVLELLTGKAFKQGSSSNPGVNAAKMLEEEFKKFADYTLAQIESNSIYREAFAVTSFLVNAETGELEFDWENLNTAITNLVEANNFIEAKRVVAIAQNLGAYNANYLAVINQNFSELAEADSRLSYLFNNTLVESDGEGIVVTGSKDNDFMAGNSKDNILNGGNGNDVLFGGAGNDLLKGGLGSDTYIFSKGHGQDIIQEQNHWMHSRDRDTLRFTDVSYDEVKFRRVNDDLMLFGYHVGDSVTIQNFYTSGDDEIEIFEFADRTFTIDELRKEGMRLYGTDGDDVINDWNDNSIIDAGAGDDVINAGRGNDTLIGGEGDDTLRGGLGADTYIFSKGHGQDIIQEQNHWMHSRDRDTLRFTDVSYDEVKFRRVENDLILFGYHDKDSITIENFYTHSDYEIEIFEFADRTFTIDELRKEGMRLYGTDSNDVINDWNSNSIIDAGAGDDIINAGDGDDTLIGGTGNDILNGGLGSDTYIFSKGHGQDIIREENRWMRLLNNKDTIRFTDVNYDEVKFKRVGNDLILSGYHQDDSVTIQDFYRDSYYEVEIFEFADRTLTLKELRDEGFERYGTEGDDKLVGGKGNDTFIGGAGNDILNGGFGSDTYLFGNNHGHDVIQENSNRNDIHSDTIEFTELDDPNRLWFSRQNNDLLIQDLENFDSSVRVKNWYRHKDYKVEQIKLANEQALDIASVEKLVQAMAAFDAAYSGDITLAPREEVQQYMDKLAVANYWG